MVSAPTLDLTTSLRGDYPHPLYVNSRLACTLYFEAILARELKIGCNSETSLSWAPPPESKNEPCWPVRHFVPLDMCGWGTSVAHIHHVLDASSG